MTSSLQLYLNVIVFFSYYFKPPFHLRCQYSKLDSHAALAVCSVNPVLGLGLELRRVGVGFRFVGFGFRLDKLYIFAHTFKQPQIVRTARKD